MRFPDVSPGSVGHWLKLEADCSLVSLRRITPTTFIRPMLLPFSLQIPSTPPPLSTPHLRRHQRRCFSFMKCQRRRRPDRVCPFSLGRSSRRIARPALEHRVVLHTPRDRYGPIHRKSNQRLVSTCNLNLVDSIRDSQVECAYVGNFYLPICAPVMGCPHRMRILSGERRDWCPTPSHRRAAGLSQLAAAPGRESDVITVEPLRRPVGS